jgi:hypothetical protein
MLLIVRELLDQALLPDHVYRCIVRHGNMKPTAVGCAVAYSIPFLMLKQ